VPSNVQQPQPLRRIPNMRPLFFSEGQLYCARYDRILSTIDWGESFHEVCQLAIKVKYQPIFRFSNLAQRVARASVYRMQILPNGTRVYIFRGGLYCQLLGETIAKRTFVIKRGSRPVSLATAKDGMTVFGEYWDNAKRAPILIYGSQDGETWNEMYRFAAGEIRHVHGVTYDRYENCFWICTGDYDDESRLIRASTDFSQVDIVQRGGQYHRFYMTTALENHLVTATDSPIDANKIRVFDKRSGEFTDVADIENASFYNCVVGKNAFVSTNAEPTQVNDESATCIWTGTPGEQNWRRFARYPVDCLYRLARRVPKVPNGLFQYSRVFFPEGHNPGPNLVCQVIGVRGEPSSMLVFDPSTWKAS